MSDAPELYPGTWAERTPDKPAVIMAESGEVMTYRELDDFANRLSRRFRAAGLQPGDHVAFARAGRRHDGVGVGDRGGGLVGRL